MTDNLKIYESEDNIPYRLKFINDLLAGKLVTTMIDTSKDKWQDDLTQNVNDIRKVLPKQYHDFNKVINQIGGKLLYIKSGSTGHTFKGLYPKDNTKPNYAVKIVAYPKKEHYGDLYDITRPENAELIMLRILSPFVTKNQTPHIVLPMCTFNTTIKTFVSLPKNDIVKNKKFDLFVKRYKKNEYYQNVSVLISEWANSGDLLDYLRKNYQYFTLLDWKVIFFQLISVLTVILEKYPGFRHNDLKANNILVHKITKKKKNNKFLYKINGNEYIIPNIGIKIKLWDFDFACIPGIVENSKVSAKWTSKINVNPERNQYYDLHYFFNTLGRKGFFPDFNNSDLIPIKVKKFVLDIIPPKYRKGKFVAERGRLLVNDEYLTPSYILENNDFFKCFRYKKKEKV